MLREVLPTSWVKSHDPLANMCCPLACRHGLRVATRNLPFYKSNIHGLDAARPWVLETLAALEHSGRNVQGSDKETAPPRCKSGLRVLVVNPSLGRS